MALDEDGLWKVDFETGNAELVLSLSQIRDHQPRPEMEGGHHRVNHAMYSPEGDRLVFMHRWEGSKGQFSRLYVASSDGEALRLLMDNRMVSHYNWQDEDHLVVWGRTEEEGDRYYIVDVRDGSHRVLGKGIFDRYGDGHPSYSPDGRWIVTDTYPDKARQRHLLLFDTRAQTTVRVGRFFAPWAYDGRNRCDLHPRWSPDGNFISIDSAHEGVRKSYAIDVNEIVQSNE
jgi:Tol biopolymer transport system component